MRTLVYLTLIFLARGEQQLWEKDASNDVYIEGSREGFEKVSLICSEKAMNVTVHLEEDFDGVFYTR